MVLRLLLGSWDVDHFSVFVCTSFILELEYYSNIIMTHRGQNVACEPVYFR